MSTHGHAFAPAKHDGMSVCTCPSTCAWLNLQAARPECLVDSKSDLPFFYVFSLCKVLAPLVLILSVGATHTYIYTHTHIHTYTHTRAHTHSRTTRHTAHTQTHRHTDTHSRARTHT